MPVYEYSCKNCQHSFEELILGSEVPVCPQCESSKLEKLVSAFGVGDSTPEHVPCSPAGGQVPCEGCCGPQGPGSCSMN